MFRDITFSLMVGAAAFIGTFTAQAIYDYQRKQTLISSIERFRDDIRSVLPAKYLKEKPPLVFQKTALDKLLDSVADGLVSAVDALETTKIQKVEFDPSTYSKIYDAEWEPFVACFNQEIAEKTKQMAVANCAKHMPYQP
ncbi:hypothetical protein [Shinella zoogloeoides]